MQENLNIKSDRVNVEFELHAQEVAERRVDELLVTSKPLLPKQALIDRCKKELIEEFITYRKRQNRGARLLTKALQELSEESAILFTDKVVNDIKSIAALSEEVIAEGVTLQELAQVDDTSMDVLYQAAKRVFEQKCYDDAADIFSFLVGLNHKTFAFSLGLANAEYQRKAYKEALLIYSSMCEAWPGEPACYLSASRCHKLLNNPDQAIVVLENACTMIAGHHDFQKWKSIFNEELVAAKQMKYT